jgi:hypothetical protein
MSADNLRKGIVAMDKLARWAAILLKTGRIVNIIAATLCIVVVVLGCATALYFQTIVSGSPKQSAVPPPPVVAAPVVGTAAVDERLTPPVNVRVNVTRPVIDTLLREGEVIGTLQADTPNGLAHFPDDVDILGGQDADLFDRRELGYRNAGQGTGIVATRKLADQVNAVVQGGQIQQRRTFALTLVARDAYGVPSKVTDVTFTLEYGPAQAEPAPAPRTPDLTDLQRLARDIAIVADREGTPTYQAAYNRAVRQPYTCGTSERDEDFIGSYRRLFDYAKPRLTAQNLPAFLDGVCDAWQKAVAERNRARADAEAARAAIMADNQRARNQHEYEAAVAENDRNQTLVVVAGAVGAFMIICLVLAFLAMESHSRAMRRAIAVIADSERRERQTSA